MADLEIWRIGSHNGILGLHVPRIETEWALIRFLTGELAESCKSFLEAAGGLGSGSDYVNSFEGTQVG